MHLPQHIFSGLNVEEAPDPDAKKLPWILDTNGQPVPIKAADASPKIVMSCTYAFRAAMALQGMREQIER